MQFKDYYQTLGVPRDAKAEDIKKAFRKLARKYHPDVSKEPDAETRMQEVNEANTVLSDPENRRLTTRLDEAILRGRNSKRRRDRMQASSFLAAVSLRMKLPASVIFFRTVRPHSARRAFVRTVERKHVPKIITPRSWFIWKTVLQA